MNDFYIRYKKEVAPALKKELGYSSIMQVPRITRVLINAGVGRFIKDVHFIETVEHTLAGISGQKPMRTRAKKAISNFKIREGQEIGVMVTLHGNKMYDFLEKLVRVTLPRVRDFHGIAGTSFDREGNYTLGFKENVAFPEVKVEEIDKVHGLQVIINTTAKTSKEARLLLEKMGFPFAKK